METGAKQDLTRLGTSTQLKLLRRQLHEWKTLLQNQRQVRQWIHKEPISFVGSTGSMAMFIERTQQLNHLSLLSIRQSEDRQLLHLHHLEEAAELDRVLEAHQLRLASR